MTMWQAYSRPAQGASSYSREGRERLFRRLNRGASLNLRSACGAWLEPNLLIQVVGGHETAALTHSYALATVVHNNTGLGLTVAWSTLIHVYRHCSCYKCAICCTNVGVWRQGKRVERLRRRSEMRRVFTFYTLNIEQALLVIKRARRSHYDSTGKSGEYFSVVT